MKEEPEASPPKKEPECSFCGEETHSYQTCPGLRQMVLEQANELTCQWVAEYEKSQEEATRHTIREEYGPATSVLDPMATRSSAAALLHPPEGRARRGGQIGEGQTPEGPSWWGQIGGPLDKRQSRPQERGTSGTQGSGHRSNQLPRYQPPLTTSTPYMLGGNRYQGTGVSPSGGLPGGGGRPPGQGYRGGGEDGYDPGDGDEEEDEDDTTSTSSEIREKFHPEDWTDGSGE